MSPAFAIALLGFCGVAAVLIQRALLPLALVALFAGARLAWLSRSLAKHKSAATWLLGLEPPKSQLQVLGELMSAGFARNPPPSYLDQLQMVVRECDDPSLVSVSLHNAGANSLCNIAAKVTDLLYPNVHAWDQWNHGGGSPTDVVSDFWQPVEVSLLHPGQTAVIQRKLFPGVLPGSATVHVKATIGDGAADYYVRVAVSSGIALYRT